MRLRMDGLVYLFQHILHFVCLLNVYHFLCFSFLYCNNRNKNTNISVLDAWLLCAPLHHIPYQPTCQHHLLIMLDLLLLCGKVLLVLASALLENRRRCPPRHRASSHSSISSQRGSTGSGLGAPFLIIDLKMFTYIFQVFLFLNVLVCFPFF